MHIRETNKMTFRKQMVKMSLSSNWSTAGFCGLQPRVVVLWRNRFQLLPNYMSVWNVFSGATALYHAGQMASLRIQLPGFRSTVQSLLLPWKYRAFNRRSYKQLAG